MKSSKRGTFRRRIFQFLVRVADVRLVLSTIYSCCFAVDFIGFLLANRKLQNSLIRADLPGPNAVIKTLRGAFSYSPEALSCGVSFHQLAKYKFRGGRFSETSINRIKQFNDRAFRSSKLED